jgi:hypothetical protein
MSNTNAVSVGSRGRMSGENLRNTDMLAENVKLNLSYITRGITRLGTLSGGGGTPIVSETKTGSSSTRTGVL